MGLVLLSVAAMLAGTTFILEDLRRAVRPGGPLQQLGAGTRQIPSTLCEAIDGAVEKFHPERRPFKLKLAVITLLLLVVVIKPTLFVHAAWHNRASAALLFMFWFFGNTFIAVWIISMRMATILSGHAVECVISTVCATRDMADWNTRVFEPAMDLSTTTMAALSAGWGRSVVVYCGLCLLGVIAVVSLALSPLALTAATHFSGFPMALHIGCGWGVVIFTLLPVYVASGPAHVSSQCDELKKALNDLRISAKSVEADAVIHVLERSLNNLNLGQGLGFLVAKTVIDKGKLNRFAKGVAGLVVTVGPVLLAWGATTGAYSVEEQCKLSKEQKEVIETVVGGFGLGCNATLLVTPKGVKIV